MKRIPLTQGKFALVDDEDYTYLSQFKWCVRSGRYCSYAGRAIERNGIYIAIQMHRVILGLKRHDGLYADHINGNGLDNRRSNLRICNHQQNQMNRGPWKREGASCYKGVTWHAGTGKWQAAIGYNRKRLYLGLFQREIAAAKAYDRKAVELFGEFAYTNCQGNYENY